MKKITMLIAFVALVFSACEFQMPEKVSIKAKADYAFSLGDFSRKLSDYFSAEDLDRELNADNTSQSKFNVYDYNPDGSSTQQQFLVDFKLRDIPIDVGDYFKRMDFSTKLKNMSFKKMIKIPAMKKSIDKPITLPDVNAKIRETAQFSIPDFPLAEGLNTTIPEVKNNITISAPTFSTMEFSSGRLVLKIKPKTMPSYDFSTNLTVALKTSEGETISSASHVNLGTSSERSVELPIAGKTLYPTMQLAVSGSTSGGTPSKTVTYEVKSTFSNDTKLSKVTGLTMNASKLGNTPINEMVDIPAPDNFVECTMGAGSYISMTALLPDGWSGVHATPTVSISGALTADDSDFDKSQESSGNALVNRTLDLNGKQVTKGTANVIGSVAISLSNATIVFRDNDTVNLKTEFSATKFNSVTLNLFDLHDNLSVDKMDPLSDDVQKYVDYMELDESGIKVTYTNTLPTGNDIIAKTDSNFFGLHKTGTIPANTINGKLNMTATGKIVHPATDDKVDFKATFMLPGATASNPDQAKFTNIEADKEYTLAFDVKPVFTWKKVGIKPESISPTAYKLDTKLNLHTLFKQAKDSLGDAFNDNDIDIVSIPVRVYCSHPEGLESLKNLKFKGTVEALLRNGNKDSPAVGKKVVLSDGTKELDFKTEHKLKFADKVVTNNVLREQASFGDSVDDKGGLAPLFNQHINGTMFVDYTLALTDGSSSVIHITKEEFDQLEKTESTSIKITARIILPFVFRLKKDIAIDVAKAAGVQTGSDLFGRQAPTNLDTLDKYMDAIQSMQLSYRSHGDFIQYIDESRGIIPALVFDTHMSGLAKTEYKIPINGGTAKVATGDVRKILERYPFTPDVKIVLPEGKMQVLRKSSPGANIAIRITTDGTIPLFGGDK